MIKVPVDDLGLIQSLTNSAFSTDKLPIPNSLVAVKAKLDYYRNLFGKTHDLNDDEFQKLKANIKKFFNLKPVSNIKKLPPVLFRISNNQRILEANGESISYLSKISQLLSPPSKYCNYGRCNLENEQVLYCGLTEASAYWETKPKNGDVITISTFILKDGANGNCSVINQAQTENPEISHELQKLYYLLEEFMIDAFSLEIDRTRPRDYIFSAILSSELFIHNTPSRRIADAILYPSVQRKKLGQNFAIKNDLIFEKYNLYKVETKFILDEFKNMDPSIEEPTTDCIMGSFYTRAFDFDSGRILYSEKVNEIFQIFRSMQTSKEKQIRFDNGPDIPKNISFNLSPVGFNDLPQNKVFSKENKKIGRNQRVTVQYENGNIQENVKFKTIEQDYIIGKCDIRD